jgi:Uma2 family endonuclease
MATSLLSAPVISWQELPPNFSLPDDPVDNNQQPLLAEALREALDHAGLISPSSLIATNFGINVFVNGKAVVKAPDWVYIPAVKDPQTTLRRCYAPFVDGAPPTIVMEFLSATEGTEYSINPRYPYGKWYFYEQILQVPVYVIFEPEEGQLDVYRLRDGKYQQETADANDRFFIPELGLALGVWRGTKAQLVNVNWLRWWDKDGNLLLWGMEKLELAQESIQREQELRQRLEEKLKALGIDPYDQLG